MNVGPVIELGYRRNGWHSPLAVSETRGSFFKHGKCINLKGVRIGRAGADGGKKHRRAFLALRRFEYTSSAKVEGMSDGQKTRAHDGMATLRFAMMRISQPRKLPAGACRGRLGNRQRSLRRNGWRRHDDFG